MALYKRNGIYHCDFMVNSARYRQTLETADRRESVQRERDLIAQAKEGKLSSKTESLARVPLPEAFDRYLKERELEISNARHEWDCSKPLRAFFQRRRLNQIAANDIRAYQAHRIGQGKKPKTVNLEVGLLLRLLKRAKLRHRLVDDVRMLTVVREPRQMPTQAEKQHLFETASTNPDWLTAYCAALLTANTSMRPKELRRLLWRDVDAFERVATVRRSKTEAGTRVIPLNDEAWSAIAALKQRADGLGTGAPGPYIFHREWPKVEPTQPMSGWRSAWRSLRKAAGMPNLGFYNLRHQFVTELRESGVPESVIRELAGHVDPAMMRIYSHPRLAARRAAVETLAAVKVGQFRVGYGTNHVTKQLPAGFAESQPIEKINRGERI
jgi:integrase